ncbi:MULTISPECIES: hypothetical protein [unclassified Aeromonas]|uniref:hypothetical protein n=1 Tax=unclassified Aeromonas TaxID=257493 RepID=UPI0022E422D8|nr:MULTISPECIES: hypothetical protein [unclassified Aeromonas]
MTLPNDHFSDGRIDEICSGASPMTAEERAYLLETVPHFEECDLTEAELAKMNDVSLMNTSYRVWADYCACM